MKRKLQPLVPYPVGDVLLIIVGNSKQSRRDSKMETNTEETKQEIVKQETFVLKFSTKQLAVGVSVITASIAAIAALCYFSFKE